VVAASQAEASSASVVCNLHAQKNVTARPCSGTLHGTSCVQHVAVLLHIPGILGLNFDLQTAYLD
jgi:hypothetical protein